MGWIFVFLGGGLGSLSRYGINVALRSYSEVYPWATFTANVISCFILGVLLGLSFQHSTLTLHQRLFFLTGFCGGFSTFSTFSAETYTLMENGHVNLSLVYVLSSVLLGLISIILGWRLSSIF